VAPIPWFTGFFSNAPTRAMSIMSKLNRKQKCAALIAGGIAAVLIAAVLLLVLRAILVTRISLV
jgi:hypothetical protein